MKEKIDQYAKGIFEYHMPEVIMTPSALSVSVDAGEIAQGSFRVSNSAGRSMKGIVCTDCGSMILEKEAFQGTDNEISFAFRGTCCEPGRCDPRKDPHPFGLRRGRACIYRERCRTCM